MAALTNADRQWLGAPYRFAQSADASIKTRHPGAREAEIGSAFVTLAGAAAALDIIRLATMRDNKLIVATCDGLLPITFRGRPPCVLLKTRRFGGDIVSGKLMLAERVDRVWSDRLTILYLIG